jgi:hypothetical protein
VIIGERRTQLCLPESLFNISTEMLRMHLEREGSSCIASASDPPKSGELLSGYTAPSPRASQPVVNLASEWD